MMTKLLNYSEKINIILILLVSFAANYYYGSIGVFPVDTFAFFDSANFINKGFLPIRDYWLDIKWFFCWYFSINFFLNSWGRLVFIFISFIISKFYFCSSYIQVFKKWGFTKIYIIILQFIRCNFIVSTCRSSISRPSLYYIFYNFNLFFNFYIQNAIKVISIFNNIKFINCFFVQTSTSRFFFDFNRGIFDLFLT